MKKFTTLVSVLVLLMGAVSCIGQENGKSTSQTANSTVKVYYFHFTHRCATCMAVEENARKAVEALYPDKVKSGAYSFTALNLDESGTKEIAGKLGVGGQTLLIVKGNKKIDITGEGFLSAHDPDKMKQEIKSAIDKVLL